MKYAANSLICQFHLPFPDFIDYDADTMDFRITTHIRNQMRATLAEDIGQGDVTSLELFDPTDKAEAVIRAKQHGVLCGAGIAGTLFLLADERLELEWRKSDGDILTPGDEILQLQGSVISLLSVERTALNFLARLSGIATLTRQYVDACEGTGACIRDTRKTTPLWRSMEKYAVRVGGGDNHRMGLDDGVMVKDTHADALGDPEILKSAVTNWKQKGLSIVFEARNMEEVECAIQSGADEVLLDNQSLEELRECIKACKGRIHCEISGGVTLSNVKQLAQLGPDSISIGSLTHSVPAFDFSMKTRAL
jgi:nicotinate-nucleotide pyrophosphorylase (carboxylating)